MVPDIRAQQAAMFGTEHPPAVPWAYSTEGAVPRKLSISLHHQSPTTNGTLLSQTGHLLRCINHEPATAWTHFMECATQAAHYSSTPLTYLHKQATC
eukprot:18294-Pelagomonas_calceolata.AAC.3